MIPTQPAISMKGIAMLLRIIAVVFSSIAAILSTVLPLIFHYSVSNMTIISVAFILLMGTLLTHGLLTHTFNDLTDYHSGTDEHSPGVLSGGSRVLQTKTMSVQSLTKLGITVSIFLLLMTGLFIFLDYSKFAILTLVGIWGAVSYSLKPFQLAYYPFIGEWFSLFPTMLLLGVAAPWILLDHIPLWAWQNALVNAIWCMAWVMVHHIPDRHADRKAQPVKRTSVVWSEDIFGSQAAKAPAILYFMFIGILAVWIAFTRPLAGIGVGILFIYSVYLTIKMNIDDVDDITKTEKLFLFFAFIIAIWLGIFVS